MKFNVGDVVWIKATRDKDRMGTITEIINENIIVDLNGIEIVFSEIELEPVVKKTTLNKRDAETFISAMTQPVALKHDNEKIRLELIPASALNEMGKAFTYGSKKYNDHNWANGFDWDRLVGALLRHTNAWRSGEDKDPESGLSHLAHILATAAMLAAHEQEGLGNDNRRKTIR